MTNQQDWMVAVMISNLRSQMNQKGNDITYISSSQNEQDKVK